ncbi:bifunctional WD40-repeat-containing domain superfamily/WD40-YVTN repeat-like-containing domain superfamily/WD40 repeat [Babesia duncani]|uniref:Bifunctional WD40-repeat-containing domain superfamily/WD40-YVTN repeat-like-containing domain superfamily/WD40 repeat n=1 Tax=Babesia duncani TaxID=323732 RepID=A0AAD9PM96_9APIC|nr:bifunctional WD40-repeat-containing domain superfamily/WD40-YVTN repeat-like-containing domain superfamily/WD40 repeat [Babesia duncani]
MLISAGGYEGGLVGLEIEIHTTNVNSSNGKQNVSYSIHPAFRFLCSQGSIKCIATGEDFLICGGTDETVQVYNLKKRRKHGELMLSQGSITALGAIGNLKNGTIFVGNELGDISLYDAIDLSLLRTLKGHKKAVSGISIHKDKHVFVSTAQDRTIRLWDLRSYLCIFYTKLNHAPIDVIWSLNGKDYLILSETELLRCSTNEEVDIVTFSPAPGDKCWFQCI